MNTLERLEDQALFEERLGSIVDSQNLKAVDLLAYEMTERHKAIRSNFAGVFDEVGHMATADNRTMYTRRIDLPPTIRRASQMAVELSTPIGIGATVSTFSVVHMEFFNRGNLFARELYKPGEFVDVVTKGQSYSTVAMARSRPGVPLFDGIAAELRTFEAAMVNAEEKLDLIHGALGKTGLMR
jgi:hypothetical protein